jgi:uncharacterized protein (DUF1800 family)
MTSQLNYWRPYEPAADAPWNLRRVVHLHRRAGFAATWAELQRDLGGDPQEAVTRLVEGRSRIDGQPSDFESTARLVTETATASFLDRRLKAAWVYRMLYGPDPLAERLALLWHNHFATSNRKVKNLVLMQGQNELFRQLGRGPFGELLSAVVRQGAMLEWLDADKNIAGHPNENLARESMELFTLGVGDYKEADVQESARALTGWKLVGEQFRFDPKTHDDKSKTILGTIENFDGDGLLKLLAAQPATAHRLAWRICVMLMGESKVEDRGLDELAAGLREHELRIAWGVETVLRSQRFFAPENLGNRIAAPPEYVVGAVRALECFQQNPSTLLMADWMARMGQDLFYPPNVGGWNEGRAWLNSGAIVSRANFATALVVGQLTLERSSPGLQQLVKRHTGQSELKPAVEWFGELLFGGLPADVVAGVEQAAMRSHDSKLPPLETALLMLLTRPEAQLG